MSGGRPHKTRRRLGFSDFSSHSVHDWQIMDPIVIDSDEDESQVAGPSSSRFNDLSSSVRANGSTNGTSSTADIGADSRDAIRIALAKLDAEVGP